MDGGPGKRHAIPPQTGAKLLCCHTQLLKLLLVLDARGGGEADRRGDNEKLFTTERLELFWLVHESETLTVLRPPMEGIGIGIQSQLQHTITTPQQHY